MIAVSPLFSLSLFTFYLQFSLSPLLSIFYLSLYFSCECRSSPARFGSHTTSLRPILVSCHQQQYHTDDQQQYRTDDQQQYRTDKQQLRNYKQQM